MKRITTLILTLAIIAQGAVSMAQIDEDKMARDLRVASGVLGSLMTDDSEHMFRGGEPEGSYVDGFGVIFTIEDNMIFRYNYKMQWDVAREAQREAQRALKEAQRAHREAERELRESERERRENDKDKEKDNSIVAPTPPIPPMDINIDMDKMKEYEVKIETANEEFSKNLKEAFKVFLVDYSQLIGQLKPSDKILLTTKSDDKYAIYLDVDGSREHISKSRLSAELLVKDHNDFSSGKLSRDNLVAKIKFIENAELERKPDLDLFGSMLKTAYDQRYTETYFISSKPKYEFLSGLGVVYSVKVYSSYDEDGLYRIPGANRSGVSKEEREKVVEEMYPKFVDNFKENIIRYGSTIKSVKSGEKLIVKVKMTSCSSCTFPKIIEFAVDNTVLDQFSGGSLSLEQAKNKVRLKS